MEESGNRLFELLIELTGLERSVIEPELCLILKKLNLSIDRLTTDDIRRVMTVYLEEVGNQLTSGESELDESGLDSGLTAANKPTIIAKA
jgi:hypothetical protein